MRKELPMVNHARPEPVPLDVKPESVALGRLIQEVERGVVGDVPTGYNRIYTRHNR